MIVHCPNLRMNPETLPYSQMIFPTTGGQSFEKLNGKDDNLKAWDDGISEN